MSRTKRKKKRAIKRAGYRERVASKSKYAAKVFERENGRPPDPQAEAKAKVQARSK
jgi:hypothetical protein